ncbi:MAG: PD-(D/E)XK nuclease family protein [Holophagaceae bacterium]|nr:PD-(D/E)XK nuclease family protein [Holophagaceae bacterium]
MSYDPFDGVLLDDPRPPVSGAVSLMLHLRVARRLAKAQGRTPGPSLEALKARAQACRELLAQGLLPATLRHLQAHGLELGQPKAAHSLSSVLTHMEAYLKEVEAGGYLEPDLALWRAVDLELSGKRGLWIERTEADGPLEAGIRDLVPTRLRALACVPGLGGATFRLAAQKGGEASGLFGSAQPLVAWFLDGLEAHGDRLPNNLGLSEPEGWGSAPWSSALESLFEGALYLKDHADAFQRGLVEGPLDLLRHAIEQVCVWVDAGIPPSEITLIHPEPQAVAAFLEPLLAEEGVALHVRGGLPPLLASEAWSPLWTLLVGVQRLDPCAVSAGLRASRRDDLRHWADALALADQSGALAFEGSFMHLRDRVKEYAQSIWQELAALRTTTQSAHRWAERLESLATTLRLPMDPDDFYSPLGLIKEAWGLETWTFPDMLLALEAFLDAARSSEIPRAVEGLRLVSPGTILDDWNGARATLILDLSEGAWPSRPAENPDLDGDRKAAINRALLAYSQAEPSSTFPPALQRFWLPRSEHGDQIPRAFQREAYAFNKVLAMTRESLVALSPAQDEDGRTTSQGPFWTALEGAAPWHPAATLHSRLRWRWEGHDQSPLHQARATAAQARPASEALRAEAPDFDRAPGLRAAWLKGQDSASPTALEGLAKCPFRSFAERVWGLQTFDARTRMSMAVGILVHHILEEALAPFVGVEGWPAAFHTALGLGPEAGADDLIPHLQTLWLDHQDQWLKELDRHIPQEQWPQAVLRLESLLPNLAAGLLRDVQAEAPDKGELALLDPARQATPKPKKAAAPPPESWRRTLLALEGSLGPVDLDLGDGHTLAVGGKVDRIERWTSDSLSFLRVVDYKTSKETTLKAYAEDDAPFGSHLQTPLYMLLAEQVYPGDRATAVLFPLKEEEPKPFTKHLATLAEAGSDGAWREKLLTNLARFNARLESGDFPPTPGEHCGQCQLAALCGRPVDVTVETEGEGD